MKANIGRRILLIVHWLISLLLVAAIGFCAVTGYGLETLKSRLGSYSTLVLVVCGVAYLLLSLAVASTFPRAPKEKLQMKFLLLTLLLLETKHPRVVEEYM